jgi:hypothetical protein
VSPAETDLFDLVSSLLVRVIDSFEKLEVVVHLHRARARPQSSLAIGRSLQLAPQSTADTLAALLRAGIVRTASSDEARWWFDPDGRWAGVIESLVELYEKDRAELLGSMKKAVLQGVLSTLSGGTYHSPRGRRTSAPS